MPGGNHAHVHVHRGHVGVARVEHQRHTHGLKRRTCQLRPVLRGRWRQLRATHMAEATARALEHPATLHDFGDAIALQRLAGRLAPGIGQEAATALAFHSLQRVGDAGLQAYQVAAHAGHGVCRVQNLCFSHQFLMARKPMSRRYCAPSK